MLAGYQCGHDPETGFSPFAFRLHQFISRGESVYASLEAEQARHLTLQGQQYVPGDRSRVLLPLVFCRECGQEYFTVWVESDQATGRRVLVPRELSDLQDDQQRTAGFLHVNTRDPWPEETEAIVRRLPDD